MALKLEIVTPDKKAYTKEVDDVVLPTSSGDIDVLAGHLPLLTILNPGEVKATTGGQVESLAIDKGFARIQEDVVSILTEAAIDVEEIDLSKVEEAKKRAQEALAKAKEENADPAMIEQLEAVARFAIAQELVKARRGK